MSSVVPLAAFLHRRPGVLGGCGDPELTRLAVIHMMECLATRSDALFFVVSQL